MTSLRTINTFHLLAALAIVLFLLARVAPASADSGRDNRAPALGDCQNLQVRAGNKVAFHVFAEGVQIYPGTAQVGVLWRPRRGCSPIPDMMVH